MSTHLKNKSFGRTCPQAQHLKIRGITLFYPHLILTQPLAGLISADRRSNSSAPPPAPRIYGSARVNGNVKSTGLAMGPYLRRSAGGQLRIHGRLKRWRSVTGRTCNGWGICALLMSLSDKHVVRGVQDRTLAGLEEISTPSTLTLSKKLPAPVLVKSARFRRAGFGGVQHVGGLAKEEPVQASPFFFRAQRPVAAMWHEESVGC